MRLALGTVQFGQCYGIANTSGQVSAKEARKILIDAEIEGFDTLDTAISYGGSETLLGEIGVKNWKLISKLPPLPDSVESVMEWVIQQVRGTLNKLGSGQLDGLLLHRPCDILGQYGSSYLKALTYVRDIGLVNSIGYSIYSPQELESLCDVFWPDIVQAPLNIIDRRLVSSGWLEKLCDKGIRIHTRSVFLQGLLLMPAASRPSWCSRWGPLWQSWDELCVQSRSSPLALSLGYVLSYPAIERVVIGVDSAKQLQQIICASTEPILNLAPSIESNDIELIEPFRWRYL